MRASEFLTEDRNSFVADQLGDKLLSAYEEDYGQKPELETPLEIVIELSKAGPKLVQWLANRYIGEEFKLEDLPAIKQALERFVQVRSQLPDEHKDLNKLSLGNLYRALAPFEDKEVVSNKQAARDKKQKFMDDGDAELIYKDKSLVIISPKTEEASCYFGKGTKWCTSATKSENHFDHYNAQGSLFVIMTKDDGKFQLHLETQAFNDAVNEPLMPGEIMSVLKKYPKLYDIFDKPARKAMYLPLIKNPDETIMLKAVDEEWQSLAYFDNPTEKIQLFAVKTCGAALQYIKKPTEQMELAGVESFGASIQYIENPSEKVQLKAINDIAYNIRHIENPTEKVQLTAIEQDGFALSYINNPSERVQIISCERDGAVVQYINDPSEAVQFAAVSRFGTMIRFIENPTEKVQLSVVKKNPVNLRYIKNPTDKVKQLARRNPTKKSRQHPRG